MQTLPVNIYSVASVREMDRTAIEDHGIPGYTLMSRAGAAATRAAQQRFPEARRWQILCGAGNNGGDGYVVARLAANDGIVVSVLTLVDPESLKGDASKAYEDYVAAGGIVTPWAGETDGEAELLIDAVLGSGLERDVGGEFGKAVAAINAHRAPVFALDIPTGIHGDSGKVLGTAVVADVTMTFVGLKAGLFLDDAPRHCGELLFDGLDIPDDIHHVSPEFRRIAGHLIENAMPRRNRAAHKGDFGHVLVVGGGAGMPGAVRLCAEAALRVGAGLVSIATDPSHAAVLTATRPELMSHGVAAASDLEPLLVRANAIAFGPGLGQTEWARRLFEKVSADSRPQVWDADALNLLAEEPAVAEHRIITPHPGEAARLLGRTTAEVQGDRCASATALAERFGGIAVLKGAGSLVTSPGSHLSICTAGNPGMASPGMGDVLTGIIAGLLAQGLDLETAAVAGVEMHARAGDRAARGGERGMIASDLLQELRAIVNP